MLLSLILTLCGCRPVIEKQPYIDPIVVVDSSGQKYRFVSPEIVNANGTTTAELWEKIEPLDTNHWYTPTLASKIYTNQPPLFNSLMR